MKTLIVMSDTGGGHRSAAEAITEALHRTRTDVIVELLDFFVECTPFPINQAGRVYGPWVNYAAPLWAALFHGSNGRRRSELGLRVLTTMAGSCIRRHLQGSQPDLIVSVHPLANRLLVQARDAVEPSTPLVTVVTDLITAHVAWFCPYVDLCVVPTAATRERAIRAGMPAEKIRVIGLPIHPRFLEPHEDSESLRAKLGLERERFTVLLIGGGEGMGRVYEMAQAVAQAGLPVQQIVIAGRNTRLQRRLRAIHWQIPTRVFGFVRNMPTLMAAADVVVTKAGPSTICEALVLGRPILLSGFIPGQERGNVDYVIQGGAGRLTETPQALITALRDFVEPKSKAYMRMAKNASRLAQPSAADEIAQLLVNLVQ